MKKRSWFMVFVLVLVISLGLTLTVGATGGGYSSSGSFTFDCDEVVFNYIVAEGEKLSLQVKLHSGPDWQDPIVQDDAILVETPGPGVMTVPWVGPYNGGLFRVAIAVYSGGIWTTHMVVEGYRDCPPPPEFAGCTPGYWRNHLEDWPPTGYSPSDKFDVVFGTSYFGSAYDLLSAVNARGGGLNKLARHGTAALLSAAHPAVNYPYTVAEVIAFVQDGDVDPLVAANELGCSIP